MNETPYSVVLPKFLIDSVEKASQEMIEETSRRADLVELLIHMTERRILRRKGGSGSSTAKSRMEMPSEMVEMLKTMGLHVSDEDLEDPLPLALKALKKEQESHKEQIGKYHKIIERINKATPITEEGG